MLINSTEATPKLNPQALYYAIGKDGKKKGKPFQFSNQVDFEAWLEEEGGECWEELPVAPTGNTNRSALLSIDTPITWETVDRFNKESQERSMRLPAEVVAKHKSGEPFAAIFLGLRAGLTKDKSRNFPQALIAVDQEKFRILVSDKLRPIPEGGEFKAQLQPTDNPAVQSGFNLVVL